MMWTDGTIQANCAGALTELLQQTALAGILNVDPGLKLPAVLALQELTARCKVLELRYAADEAARQHLEGHG